LTTIQSCYRCCAERHESKAGRKMQQLRQKTTCKPLVHAFSISFFHAASAVAAASFFLP
jgi:hypothetical protein